MIIYSIHEYLHVLKIIRHFHQSISHLKRLVSQNLFYKCFLFNSLSFYSSFNGPKLFNRNEKNSFTQLFQRNGNVRKRTNN